MVRGDQRSATKSYSNFIKKVKPSDVNVILKDIDEVNDLEQGYDVKIIDVSEE